uniref:Uncharacterized protein n=1 Tax=Setaria viridis TaxID=4556 RepID=A0A4U6WM70_SETVI|nr:hypothetical protein SEVIR_1G187300v2 [Setaria viridis]
MFVDCFCSATPRGLVPQLARKKALRVLFAPAGRTAAPPAASGGVPGEVAGSTAEVAPAAATGGVVPPPGTGEGADPAPPSASSADPAVQSIAPWGPQAGEDTYPGGCDRGGGGDGDRDFHPGSHGGGGTGGGGGGACSRGPDEGGDACPGGRDGGQGGHGDTHSGARVGGGGAGGWARGGLDGGRGACAGTVGGGDELVVTRVLGTYRWAREIALEALHTGVRQAFGVFGSHYSGINFAGMSGGYAAGYSEAELDEIDASVFNPTEALVKLLEDEAIPPEDPRTS